MKIVMAMRSFNIPCPISGFNCGDIDYGDAFLGTGGWKRNDVAEKLDLAA